MYMWVYMLYPQLVREGGRPLPAQWLKKAFYPIVTGGFLYIRIYTQICICIPMYTFFKLLVAYINT